MKQITRFIYIRGGQRYSGALEGTLNEGQIQQALLKRGTGCQKVLSVSHETFKA